jgi:cupin fold WbuC family metalloprotein
MIACSITPEDLDSLVREASGSPRRRKHRNLHESYDDPCQRVLNAIGIDSYIRPHRHSLDPKRETMVAVRGAFALVCFDEQGHVIEALAFGTELYNDRPSICPGVEVPAGAWHTVLALVPRSVLLEVKAGPFLPQAAKEFAPWAPEEESEGVGEFLASLHALAQRLLPCSPGKL